jgi:hypothetical protein
VVDSKRSCQVLAVSNPLKCNLKGDYHHYLEEKFGRLATEFKAAVRCHGIATC